MTITVGSAEGDVEIGLGHVARFGWKSLSAWRKEMKFCAFESFRCVLDRFSPFECESYIPQTLLKCGCIRIQYRYQTIDCT